MRYLVCAYPGTLVPVDALAGAACSCDGVFAKPRSFSSNRSGRWRRDGHEGQGRSHLRCGEPAQHRVGGGAELAGCRLRRTYSNQDLSSSLMGSDLESGTAMAAGQASCWSEQVVLTYQDERARPKVERLVAAEWGEEAAAGCAPIRPRW